MTTLGTFGGTASGAKGINTSGQVVGASMTSSNLNHAFLYSGGSMSDLGMLSGGSESGANGINASGQIVGVSSTSSGYNHAFLYSNGTMTDLGTLPNRTTSEAFGINASGQVVGVSYNDISDNHAFLIVLDGYRPEFTHQSCSWLDVGASNTPSTITGKLWAMDTIPAGMHAFRLTPMLPGDANGDSSVDGSDLGIVLSHYNTTAPLSYVGWTDGDFNGDGSVDGSDLGIVLGTL